MSRRRRHRPTPGKGIVTFVNEHVRDWRTAMEQTDVFVALATPEWLRQPRLWEHVDYARQLGLPFRIALIGGTVLPEGLFAGVTDLEIQPCQTPEDVEQYVLAVLQRGHGTPAPPAGEGEG